MLTEDGPTVLELKCRFGDPETQSILPRIRGDLLDALAAAARGDLGGANVEAEAGAAVTVVLAGREYPEQSDSGTPIDGIQGAAATGAIVFHAGTAMRGDRLVTNGGRVLNVTARADSVEEARRRVYEACEAISLDGMRYRRDTPGEGLAVARPRGAGRGPGRGG